MLEKKKKKKDGGGWNKIPMRNKHEFMRKTKLKEKVNEMGEGKERERTVREEEERRKSKRCVVKREY